MTPLMFLTLLCFGFLTVQHGLRLLLDPGHSGAVRSGAVADPSDARLR